MSFEVHREPLYRRYYSSFTSGACCYSVISGFMLIFLPLIIAYNTSSFWIKEDVAYEQPKVTYRYQTIVELYGSNGDSPVNLFYSTSPTINKLYSSTLRVPLLQSAELDDNRDGRTDRIEIAVQMPLAPTESIKAFSCLVYCDVELDSPVKYVFDAVSYSSYESSTAMTKLSVDGDLKLRQTWPLTQRGGFRHPYDDDELIDIEADTSADEVSISSIMQRSNARNLSMVYTPNSAFVDRRLSTVPDDLSAVQFFNASLVIRIPTQAIRYTPQVTTVLKDAWIQYVSFFIVVAFLLFRLNSFVFRHKILHTYATADVVYEKMD